MTCSDTKLSQRYTEERERLDPYRRYSDDREKNAHLNNCFIAYYQLKLYCYKVVIKSSAFAIDYR